MSEERRHGARGLGDGRWRFSVWAPEAASVELRLLDPRPRFIPMDREGRGYWRTEVAGLGEGVRYLYRLDGEMERPDPASRRQPEGVHGPSALAAEEYAWTDGGWRGVPLGECVFYELHVGTYTAEGTFQALIPHLDALRELGVTVVELMPAAQFPGGRNWGYDGVYPFAAQDSYGGPEGLKGLVDACHARGLAVALDVVHNHLGPEGNYLSSYGPYFTDRYRTPWGRAVNFDGPGSGEVRRFFIESALQWVEEFHIDALRLDAVHAIHDESAIPYLEELGGEVRRAGARLGRSVLAIAESDRNDPRLIRSRELGGMGLDAQWSDDFHHALRTLLTGDRSGYYVDFGELGHLAKAYREGYVYTGEYSRFRGRRHGRPASGAPPRRFVVFSQNHDQVGNRMLGERPNALLPYEKRKLAAACVLLSPFLPLLFMGEEYGETAPFLYFTSHSDEGLIEAVREGRKREFRSFAWEGEPPDPQAVETFLRSKPRHEKRGTPEGEAMWRWYRRLIECRKLLPRGWPEVREDAESGLLTLRAGEWAVLLHFGGAPARAPLEGTWEAALDSSALEWLGPGVRPWPEVAPHSAMLCRRARQETP